MTADQFYLAIWTLCASLAGQSCLIMVVLILARFIDDGRAATARRLRRAVRKRLVAWAVSAGPDTPKLELSDDEIELAARHLKTIITNTPAEKRTRLIDMLIEAGLFDAMAELVESDHIDERRQMIESLEIIADKDANELLTACLSNSDPEIQANAIILLSKKSALPPTAELIERLDIGDDRPPRSLLTALQATVAERRVGAKALDDQDSPVGLKIAAIHALIDTPEDIDHYFVKATADDDMNVQAQALRALGLRRSDAAREILPDALQDEDWPVQTQAAFCAGRLQLDSTIPVLQALLEDPSWWLRYRAAHALVLMGDAGLAILNEAKQTPTRSGRIAGAVLTELHLGAA